MSIESQYDWNSAHTGSHFYHAPEIIRILNELKLNHGKRILDLGCGNGSLTAVIRDAGYHVVGIEASSEGVSQARALGIEVHQGSAYDDLDFLGSFDAVVCAEVIEHLYSPKSMLKRVNSVLRMGDYFIVTTPYHGYIKNMIISITGKWDHHFTVLEEHMHIKFFSMYTLGRILDDYGFQVINWKRLGRVPVVAKSMIAVAKKIRDV